MAFQAASLPNISTTVVDLWPSIANTVMVPWRGISPIPKRSVPREATAPAGPAAATQPVSTASTVSEGSPQAVELPDFLQTVSPDVRIIRRVDAGGLAHLQSPLASVSNMSRHSIAGANSLMLGAQRRMMSSTSRPAGFMRAIFDAARQEPSRRLTRFSSTSSLGAVRFLSHVNALRRSATLQQSRQFGSGGISRSILANREAAANRNPTSGTAQNAFYQALLMANMPALVVERYQSGQFASNEAADEAYNKALGMLSTGGTAGIGNASAISNLGLTDTQLQAVGQAVAAQTQGGRIAIAKGIQGGGGKDGPIHVVVDESFGGVVFRWVKFGLWFMLVTYLSLVVVTMALDGLNTIKRPTSRTDSETKAENQTARFSDVHGCDEAKEELQELVEFLRNPDKFNTLGGKLPKGVLLVGPPGTGKTLLARAVAGEAGVPFFYMSGSEFDEVYVGVGAKRVRDLFAAAKAKSPSIVFIDELDAVGGKRNSRDQAYAKQTLNQLLTELDGFEQNSGVIIIGATNFPKSLDKALTRPGRFDRLVSVPLPDMRGRIEILKHHSKKIKAAPDVNLETIAALSSGMSGADLESIVNQAAVHATKAKKTSVTTADFDWARDKVIMGPERKTMVITPKEKEMTAYHEAGHALVSYYANATKGGPREGGSQLYKVTILPRGETLGHTAFLPEMDKYSHSAQDYMGEIEVAFGGKLAEEMIYGNDKVTSGCAADLDRATQIGWQMVAQLGMSERLGNVEYSRNYKILSSETKAAVETELKRTLDEAYQRARKLLLSRRKELELLAKALVQYETLDLDEVDKVLRGEKLPNRVPVPLGPMTVRRPEALESPPPSGVPGLAPIPGSDVTDGGGKTPPGPPAAGGLAAREGRRDED